MPIADDIRAIGDRAIRQLDGVHDFFEHSKLAWETVKLAVEAGRQLTFESPATGSSVNQNDLLVRADQYTRDYLRTFTFRHFVTIFEGFLFELLHNSRSESR